MWQLRLSLLQNSVVFIYFMMYHIFTYQCIMYWSNNSSKIENLTLVQQLIQHYTDISVTYLPVCLESTDHYCFNLYLLIFCRFVRDVVFGNHLNNCKHSRVW